MHVQDKNAAERERLSKTSTEIEDTAELLRDVGGLSKEACVDLVHEAVSSVSDTLNIIESAALRAVCW